MKKLSPKRLTVVLNTTVSLFSKNLFQTQEKICSGLNMTVESIYTDLPGLRNVQLTHRNHLSERIGQNEVFETLRIGVNEVFETLHCAKSVQRDD